MYVPKSQQLCVDLEIFKGQSFSIYLYDPRYNIKNLLSTGVSETKFLNMTIPEGNLDYVLLLVKN